MRVLFVHQNQPSPAGLVGDAFAGLGYDVSEFTVVPRERYHSPQVTVTFPEPDGYDAIVAFGAAWAVYDEATTGTWIHDEIAFTQRAIAAGIPVLGICFGGQMLAAALGGSVARAPSPEIGWYTVDSSEPGLIDPGPWFQWHSDRFTVLPGTRVVARTGLADQAFVSGRSLGLQFHPELTSAVLTTWLCGGGDSGGGAEDSDGAAGLVAQGIDVDGLLARTRALEAEAAPRARELVRRFVRDVATAPVDATVLTPRSC
ncbi:MAG TPA: type 1 glutamine amidotransferase [Trebonia sp.]|nr:type 1 glutamine amidotransferase [Trebonia sp.]